MLMTVVTSIIMHDDDCDDDGDADEEEHGDVER